MHFHNYQERILGSRSKVKLLQVLFRLRETEFTGDDLARKASISKPMAHLSLSQLMEENVVTRRVVGRAYLYRLTPDSYPVRLVAPLFRDEDSPLEELSRIVRKKLPSQVISAILYGSLVRREEGSTSDIDLYLIVKRENDRERVEKIISGLSQLTTTRFGNRLSAMIQTVGEFQRAYKQKRSLELRIEAEGRVLLGQDVREVLK